MDTKKAVPANASEDTTIGEQTLPQSDVPTMAECRKPLKKRRVLIPNPPKPESKEITPQPIELVRQVATFWETTSSCFAETSERDASGNLVAPKIVSKPGPYNYEDCYKAEKKDSHLSRMNYQDSSNFRSLAFSSHRIPKSNAQTPVFNPIPLIVELKKPPRRLDDDEEDDLEEELNCLTLCSDAQTLPKQQDRQLNAVTPSPTAFGTSLPDTASKKNSSGRIPHLFDKTASYQPSDFDPIPWSCDSSSAGLVESAIDFLMTMELESLDPKSSKVSFKDNQTETPSNSPKKTEKRVRFNPAANTVVTITPRKSKKTIVVPARTSQAMYTVQPSQAMYAVQPSQGMYAVQPSQGMYAVQSSQGMYAVQPSQAMYAVQPSQAMYERRKSRIEEAMGDYPLLSPVKRIQLGQSSSAFSPQDGHHVR